MLKNTYLFAFDLDGTLLTTNKVLTKRTLDALHEIHSFDCIIAFASGRIKSSMFQYINLCPFPIAILSLNGAEVYLDKKFDYKQIFATALPSQYANFLCNHSTTNNIALNYYIDGKIFSVLNSETSPWIQLYQKQTGSEYQFINSFEILKNKTPSKIIMIGAPEELDAQQTFFSKLWKDEIYLCRTWDYYLEFLPLNANKGVGLQHLANAYAIELKNVIAFGDAENDIPMLQIAGTGIAVKNASDQVKSAATRISLWNNDEDAIAREWNTLKNELNII